MLDIWRVLRDSGLGALAGADVDVRSLWQLELDHTLSRLGMALHPARHYFPRMAGNHALCSSVRVPLSWSLRAVIQPLHSGSPFLDGSGRVICRRNNVTFALAGVCSSWEKNKTLNLWSEFSGSDNLRSDVVAQIPVIPASSALSAGLPALAHLGVWLLNQDVSFWGKIVPLEAGTTGRKQRWPQHTATRQGLNHSQPSSLISCQVITFHCCR